MPKNAKAEFDSVMSGYSKTVQPSLKRLRKLVHEVVSATPEIGEIVETLKWGQPSFLPKRARIGTTVRMDAVSETPPRVALYFHCQTTLVDTFRHLYPDALEFKGNRAVLLDASKPLPEAELRHCIEMALIYHVAKRASAT
ncbi:MAG: DUF1801 domain-containing protein [Candidatus Phaeomarinobacter sp.]